MRYRELIYEAKIFPLTGDSVWGAFETTILFDPFPTAIKSFMKRKKTSQLRGIACDSHIYLWSAFDVTHIVVRKTLGLSGGADFWIIFYDEEPMSPDWTKSDDDPIRDGLLLLPGRDGRADPSLTPLLKWFENEPISEQRLDEGRDAPLYHMMDARKAESIFRNDTMYATTQHKLPSHGYIFGSSFTRWAKRWNTVSGNKAYGSVWIEVDQTKLTQRHKMIPVDGEWALGFKHGYPEQYKDRGSEEFAKNLLSVISTIFIIIF